MTTASRRQDAWSTVIVDGVAIEYLQLSGSAQRPTLVLLHEGLGCVALWRDFPQQLAAATGCGVLAWSRAGYGGSQAVLLPRPLDYMSREARGPLPRLLQLLDVREHLLVGHSDGATIALVNAGVAPRSGLLGVVAMAPHVIAEPSGLASIAQVREAYARGDLRTRLAKYHGANVDCAFHGWCDSWLDPAFAEWSVEGEVSQVNVPVLLIQGTDDEYGTEEQLRRIECAVRGPVTTRLLDSCGHAPHQDQRAATVEAITGFVRRCLPPSLGIRTVATPGSVSP